MTATATRTPKNIVCDLPALLSASAPQPSRLTCCLLEDFSLSRGQVRASHALKDGMVDGAWVEVPAAQAQALFAKLDTWLRKKGVREAKDNENEMAIGLWELGETALVLALDGGGSDCMAAALWDAACDMELQASYESSSHLNAHELDRFFNQAAQPA